MTYQQTDEGEIQRLYNKTNRQAARIEQLEAERDAFRLALRAYRSDKEMGEKMIEELGINVSGPGTGER